MEDVASDKTDVPALMATRADDAKPVTKFCTNYFLEDIKVGSRLNCN